MVSFIFEIANLTGKKNVIFILILRDFAFIFGDILQLFNALKYSTFCASMKNKKMHTFLFLSASLKT